MEELAGRALWRAQAELDAELERDRREEHECVCAVVERGQRMSFVELQAYLRVLRMDRERGVFRDEEAEIFSEIDLQVDVEREGHAEVIEESEFEDLEVTNGVETQHVEDNEVEIAYIEDIDATTEEEYDGEVIEAPADWSQDGGNGAPSEVTEADIEDEEEEWTEVEVIEEESDEDADRTFGEDEWEAFV